MTVEGILSSLEIDINNDYLFVVSEKEQTCRVYNAKKIILSEGNKKDDILFVDFLKYPRELLIIRKEGQIELRTIQSADGYQSKILDKFSDIVSAAVSSNGRFVLIVHKDSAWKLWDRKTGASPSGRFTKKFFPGGLISVSTDGKMIHSFNREEIEFIKLPENKKILHELAMLPHKIKPIQDNSLRIIGINNRLQALPKNCLMAADVQFNEQGYAHFGGPFQEDFKRTDSLALSSNDTFIVSVENPNKTASIRLWDVIKLELLGEREIDSSVCILDITEDGQLALVQETSKSLINIIDCSRPDLKDNWLYPLGSSVHFGVIEDEGDLVVLDYKGGGIEILQRM